MKKSGQPAQEAVDKGVAQCIQKSGVLGVVVKIMPADYKTGDGVEIKKDDLKKVQKEMEIKLGKTRKRLEVEEEVIEGEIDEEVKEIIDEVDEEDVEEISIEPEEEENKE
jgi:ribosomal protein S3